MRLFSRPYDLLVITAVIIFTLSFFIPNKTADFHLYDTYVVIDSSIIFRVTALVFCFFWGIYRLTYRYLLSHFFTWLHIIIIVVAPIVILVLLLQNNSAIHQSEKDYLTFQELYNYQKQSVLIKTATVILIIGQLFYVINLIAGLYKRLAKR